MARKRISRSEAQPAILVDFLSRLRRSLRSALPDSSVYLTGSFARGDWLEDSDVDLIVVSERFRGMEVGERYKLVKKLAPQGFSLEVLAYSPREFARAKKRSSILSEMMHYAQRID